MSDDEKIEVNESQFRKELTVLINKYSIENGSDTPDYLLAEMLVMQLHIWDQFTNRREQWYGRKSSPNNNGEAI